MSAQVDGEVFGETSKDGLRRMKRLAMESRGLSTLSRAIIHPTTGEFIHPAPYPHAGHVISSLYPGSTGRLLPIQPGREISCSHDGEYIVVFHPVTGSTEGGTLAIYPRTILSPYAKITTSAPLSTLVLPKNPLSIIHLYPPRRYTPSGLAAHEGPFPPMGYEGSRGPVLLVLVPDALLLIHPQRSVTGAGWQMNVLKASLNSRSYIRSGDIIPIATGPTAIRAWSGVVSGDKGVWFGMDMEGEVKVLRVDVGVDETGRWFIHTTPMPKVTLHRPQDSEVDDSNSHLQAILFMPLSSETDEAIKKEDRLQKSKEGVTAVFISQEGLDSGTARTRMDSLSFQRRGIILADGFNEINGQVDVPPTDDWGIVADDARSSLSPAGIHIIDIVPTTAFGPRSLALAVLATESGNFLCHLSLDPNVDEQQDRWSAIQGKEVALTELRDITGLIPSLSVMRGCEGLIGVISPQRTVLVPFSRLSDSEDGTKTLDSTPDSIAESIYLSVRQYVDWSDVVRYTTPLKRSEREDLVRGILHKCYDLFKVDIERVELVEIACVQIALYGTYDHSRREVASELLRLHEASLLYQSMVIQKDQGLAFDLESVWPLIFVSEWVLATIANALREIITERGNIEWDTEERTPSLKVLYAINPYARNLVELLLAQIKAFIAFVATLNRPIPPPETRITNGLAPLRDVRATALAKDRAKGMAMSAGVDIQKWGQAFMNLRKTSITSESDLDSFLTFKILSSPSEIKTVLDKLPNPSSLFIMENDGMEVYDRVTFMKLPRKNIGARCNRCQGVTVAIAPGSFSVVIGEEGGWARWKEERKGGCGCGGVWTRR